MSDNEDSTAALGDSKVESVQHSVGVPIPELPQEPEDGTKVPSVVGRHRSRDVLPDDPPGLPASSQIAQKSEIGKGELTARIIEAKPASALRERLARGSGNEEIEGV
jgi:hypothetical protein